MFHCIVSMLTDSSASCSLLLNPSSVCFFLIVLFLVFTLDVVASLVAQLVKNPPAMPETPVQFLGREDPLEKG